jgi:hypothetical protein
MLHATGVPFLHRRVRKVCYLKPLSAA